MGRVGRKRVQIKKKRKPPTLKLNNNNNNSNDLLQVFSKKLDKRSVVTDILQRSNLPLTTAEIYKRAMEYNWIKKYTRSQMIQAVYDLKRLGTVEEVPIPGGSEIQYKKKYIIRNQTKKKRKYTPSPPLARKKSNGHVNGNQMSNKKLKKKTLNVDMDIDQIEEKEAEESSEDDDDDEEEDSEEEEDDSGEEEEESSSEEEGSSEEGEALSDEQSSDSSSESESDSEYSDSDESSESESESEFDSEDEAWIGKDKKVQQFVKKRLKKIMKSKEWQHKKVVQKMIAKKKKRKERKKKRRKRRRRERKREDEYPDPPKRPAAPYMYYVQDVRNPIKDANPDISFGDLSRLIASKWKKLSDAGKAKYLKKGQKDKARYIMQRKIWEGKKKAIDDKYKREDDLKKQKKMMKKQKKMMKKRRKMLKKQFLMEKEKEREPLAEQVEKAPYLRIRRKLKASNISDTKIFDTVYDYFFPGVDDNGNNNNNNNSNNDTLISRQASPSSKTTTKNGAPRSLRSIYYELKAENDTNNTNNRNHGRRSVRSLKKNLSRGNLRLDGDGGKDANLLSTTLSDKPPGSTLKDIMNDVKTVEEQLISTVAAAPVPGHALHSLACQEKRDIPVYIVPKASLKFRFNATNLKNDQDDAYRSSKYQQHRLLKDKDAREIVESRPRALNTPRSLDLLPISSHSVLLSVISDIVSESYVEIEQRFYRTGRKYLNGSMKFDITRLYFLTAGGRFYEINPETDFIVFASTVVSVIVEIRERKPPPPIRTKALGKRKNVEYKL